MRAGTPISSLSTIEVARRVLSDDVHYAPGVLLGYPWPALAGGPVLPSAPPIGRGAYGNLEPHDSPAMAAKPGSHIAGGR